MTAATLPNLTTAKLGIIGTRQLIIVQTLDIARLTAHPVRLIPETFIAVTGMGPIDSNESGKTSFLAAVALLLGDPEWRVSGNGAGAVASLLFEPVTAGITVGATAATEGYIVGVFADPEHVSDSACTVWMKISSGTPYIQVRHAPGIHLATGMDDQERHATASRVFRSLPGDTLGGGEFAEKLYGRSPRVLAYVASRGQIRSRPSLLKLDAGTFTPEQIGEALISLTGRAALFERDEQDRRDLANKQTELENHIAKDRQHTAREAEIIRQVDAREHLRKQTQAALKLWNASLARAVLDSYARAASAESLLFKANQVRTGLAVQVEQLTARQDELRDLKSLESALREREGTFGSAKEAHEQAIRVEGQLAGSLTTLDEQIDKARQDSNGYDLSCEPSAEAAILERNECTESVGEAKADLRNSKSVLEDTLRAREQATKGQFGESGDVIRLLAEKNITAKSLVASISLQPSHRHEWEARLAPWRHAIVVAHGDLAEALPLLHAHPGTILVSEPRPGTGAEQAAPPIPTGVTSAPTEALSFLETLNRQDVNAEPVIHAREERTGVRIIGGFETPTVGYDDLLAYWDQQVVSAERRHGECEAALNTANTLARLAGMNAKRAQAAEEHAALTQRRSEVEKQLTNHRQRVMPQLSEALEDAETRYRAAQKELDERTERLNTANADLATAKSYLRSKDDEITKYKAASWPEDAMLAAWGRGLDSALRELRWPTLQVDHDYDALVDEATPPISGGDGDDGERRNSRVLHDLAHDKLVEAIAGFRVYPDGGGSPPNDVAEVASDYAASRERSGTASADQFITTLAAISAWLDDSAGRDASAHEAVAQAQAERGQTTEFVSAKCRELEQALLVTQGAIKQRASSALDRISKALDTLNRKATDLGAELDYALVPPDGPDKKWICQITPKWRRNPAGPMLAYDNVTNTAQEKLFSIHLVLAALLAAPHSHGRVLILDELADSLGAEHRREVLNAIAGVAREHGITILATCQDSIMSEVSPHCKEILYFHYPSKSEALNRPTRMFGVDPIGDRIELTADALIEGRNLI